MLMRIGSVVMDCEGLNVMHVYVLGIVLKIKFVVMWCLVSMLTYFKETDDHIFKQGFPRRTHKNYSPMQTSGQTHLRLLRLWRYISRPTVNVIL
jgi:hypothetical protein